MSTLCQTSLNRNTIQGDVLFRKEPYVRKTGTKEMTMGKKRRLPFLLNERRVKDP